MVFNALGISVTVASFIIGLIIAYVLYGSVGRVMDTLFRLLSSLTGSLHALLTQTFSAMGRCPVCGSSSVEVFLHKDYHGRELRTRRKAHHCSQCDCRWTEEYE